MKLLDTVTDGSLLYVALNSYIENSAYQIKKTCSFHFFLQLVLKYCKYHIMFFKWNKCTVLCYESKNVPEGLDFGTFCPAIVVKVNLYG